ncbi:MAG: CBS domain-containing protein [Aeromicrobium erythreum]
MTTPSTPCASRCRPATRATPVLDDDDRLVGVVHLVDVMTAREGTAADLAREPVVVPEVMLLPVARRTLERARQQLACVIDEYGGLSGVLTIEDLAEELVGEITDEHDDERPLAVVDGDDAWLFSGDAPLDEVERVIDHDLPELDDVETVSGLVIAQAGALPEAGDGVELDLPPDAATLVLDDQPAAPRLRFDVLEVEHYVPSSVRVSWVVRPYVEPSDDADDVAPQPADETEVPR